MCASGFGIGTENCDDVNGSDDCGCGNDDCDCGKESDDCDCGNKNDDLAAGTDSLDYDCGVWNEDGKSQNGRESAMARLVAFHLSPPWMWFLILYLHHYTGFIPSLS